ncbi:MAG: hypothetical protein GF355_12065 [Candidatus Eisenbacteria bacterium]|nr:hypothetical protein [Candidatus Eisenbacteria bacterium]
MESLNQNSDQLEESFLRVMRVAALQAGRVASLLQGNVRAEIKEGERSPEGAALTAVDLAAQDVILYALHAALPDIAVDAEEDTAAVALFPPERLGEPVIVIDPVDGTLNYTRGSPDYAVMAALVCDGRYRTALVHLPATGRTAWAHAGHGCRTQSGGEDPLPVRSQTDRSEIILTSPWVPRSWRRAIEGSGFRCETSRCSAIDAAIGALGGAAGSVSYGDVDRRRSIGFLLTTEAGGVVECGGREWHGEDPASLRRAPSWSIAADSPQTAARLRDALRRHL